MSLIVRVNQLERKLKKVADLCREAVTQFQNAEYPDANELSPSRLEDAIDDNIRMEAAADLASELLAIIDNIPPHPKHGPGLCPVCNHYGDDCTGE